jgi:hypothetical protein
VLDGAERDRSPNRRVGTKAIKEIMAISERSKSLVSNSIMKSDRLRQAAGSKSLLLRVLIEY